MMSVKLIYNVIVLFTMIQMYTPQRRIKDGKVVEEEKKYVVYLTKAPQGFKEYDEWICGGAIVTEWYIVTSAACVEDVPHMYAIAGYKTYVPFKDLQTDKCTKSTRRTIVFICVPKLHEFEYARVEKWSQVDIAVVKVDKKYDFETDEPWKSDCDYTPSPIEINYDPHLQEDGLNVVTFGWGHEEIWRKPGDKHDYNQKVMHYASSLLHNKEECKKYFTDYPTLHDVIDKYMLCTLEPGSINEAGRERTKLRPSMDGCIPIPLNANHSVCEEDETESLDYRKNMLSRILRRQQNLTRKQGICQNDHGGPLVAWTGSHEVLVGVASVFRVTGESKCTGPYLYTSTQCNSIFLDCIISDNKTRRSGDICDRPSKEKGFDIISTRVSWKNHPNGMANNEMVAAASKYGTDLQNSHHALYAAENEPHLDYYEEYTPDDHNHPPINIDNYKPRRPNEPDTGPNEPGTGPNANNAAYGKAPNQYDTQSAPNAHDPNASLTDYYYELKGP